MTDPRRAPHSANTLNELPGEEWLYFTKSLLSTAYPSELGHGARRAHGANKPPRLMARLIEFFTTSGELVLDPFAGVGGTLLGAAITRGARRALGIEIDARWAAVYEGVVRDLLAERDGLGPVLADLGAADPAGCRTGGGGGCRRACPGVCGGGARGGARPSGTWDLRVRGGAGAGSPRVGRCGPAIGWAFPPVPRGAPLSWLRRTRRTTSSCRSR